MFLGVREKIRKLNFTFWHLGLTISEYFLFSKQKAGVWMKRIASGALIIALCAQPEAAELKLIDADVNALVGAVLVIKLLFRIATTFAIMCIHFRQPVLSNC